MDRSATDAIAGPKISPAHLRSAASLQSDEPVLHGDRKATFIRMHRGAAIIRYWGDSRATSVPPGSLALLEVKRRHLPPPA